VRVSCGTVGGVAFEGLAGHQAQPTGVAKPPLGKFEFVASWKLGGSTWISIRKESSIWC
jgi:hypothetical protein